MKNFFISCFTLLAVCTTIQAQNDDRNIFNHVGAGIELGTTGIGVELSTCITNYVQIRAGVSLFPSITVKDNKVDISANQSDWNKVKSTINELQGYSDFLTATDKAKIDNFANKYMNSDLPNNILVDGKFNMMNTKVLLDVYPFKNSSFHLTTGFYIGNSQLVEAYTTNCQDQFMAITDFNRNFAGQSIPVSVPGGYSESVNFPGKIGVKLGDYLLEPYGDHVRSNIKVSGFKPYVGVGFGRAIPQKHRLAFNCDLGAMIWNSPKIYVEQGSGDIQIEESGLGGKDGGAIKTLSKLSVYPCVTFRLTGRLF